MAVAAGADFAVGGAGFGVVVDEILEVPFWWADDGGGFLMEEDWALTGGFLAAIRAASSLLFDGDGSEVGFWSDKGRFSSGREAGFELVLLGVVMVEEGVGFDGAGEGFPEADEFSLGILPFGAITFVVVGPGLVALGAGGALPALNASYWASFICFSFSDRRGSCRIRSRIFFCSMYA